MTDTTTAIAPARRGSPAGGGRVRKNHRPARATQTPYRQTPQRPTP